MTTHDEIAELLGAYALDAVDPDERAAVERHLAECLRCAAEAADHREVAAMLAHTGGDAPAGVWTKIADALEEEPPEFRPPPRPDLADTRPVAADAGSGDEVAARREHRARRRPVFAVAAAAAALVIGLVVGTVVADDGSSGPADDQIADASLDAVARDVLNDPDATKVTLTSDADDSLTAQAAIEADGSGYLLATGLPALEPAETYQLWGIRGDDVVSLGVLGNSPRVVAFHVDPGTETLAITQEVAGGVPASSNDPFVVGNVD